MLLFERHRLSRVGGINNDDVAAKQRASMHTHVCIQREDTVDGAGGGGGG